MDAAPDFEALRARRNAAVQEVHQKMAEEYGVPLQSLRSNFKPAACYCACEQGCNGCDECTDYDDSYDEPECQRCHGDGMDQWNDYLLPCPECGGRDAP